MNNIKVEDQFVRRVIRCFGISKFTELELEKEYDRIYPLPRVPFSIHGLGRIIRRSYSIDHVSVNIADVLSFLCKEGYCSHEISYFTDREVEEGAKLYFLTKKGKDLISQKK